MAVNKENINRTIAVVQDATFPFDMSSADLCIIGAAKEAARRNDEFIGSASDYLGLAAIYRMATHDRHCLFMPPRYEEGVYTRDDAVKVLTHLRDTGEVKWDEPTVTGEQRD